MVNEKQHKYIAMAARLNRQIVQYWVWSIYHLWDVTDSYWFVIKFWYWYGSYWMYLVLSVEMCLFLGWRHKIFSCSNSSVLIQNFNKSLRLENDVFYAKLDGFSLFFFKLRCLGAHRILYNPEVTFLRNYFNSTSSKFSGGFARHSLSILMFFRQFRNQHRWLSCLSLA